MRRIRPSVRNLFFSLVFTAVALYLCAVYLGLFVAFSMLLGVLPIMSLVTYARVRGIGPGLPEPHGRGQISVVGTGQTYTQGVLILLALILALFVPFIALSFFPGAYVILGILVLMGCLSSSEILTFAWVSRLEWRTSSEIYLVTELDDENGKQVLVKSIELRPPENEGRGRFGRVFGGLSRSPKSEGNIDSRSHEA